MIIFSNNRNEFYSIDLKTGSLRWKQNINSSVQPTIINNLIFTVTKEGFLTACCVDYENDLVYEKFQKDLTLKEMFNNKTMLKLRKKHLDNNLDGTICKSCIYNEISEYDKLTDYEVKNSKKIDLNKIAKLKDRLNKLSE